MTQNTKLREKPLSATITRYQRKEIASICSVGVQYVHTTLHEFNKNPKKRFGITQSLILKVAAVFVKYNINAVKAARKKAFEVNQSINKLRSNTLS